jgi:prepilin-type N-terminal cleavage/methylation domain-containing protein
VKRGFTLLELIAAASIFVIVITASYALFDGSRRVAASAEFKAKLFQTGRAALKTIEDDLRGAVASGSVYDIGLLAVNGGTPAEPLDSVELTSVVAGRSRRSIEEFTDAKIFRPADLAHVAWWVEPAGKKSYRGLVRERSAVLAPPENRVRRDEDVEEIAKDVAGLDLRWYDGQWREEWDSTQSMTFPRAVEITVTVRGEFRGEEATQSFTTRLFLPLVAEAGEEQP